MRHKYQTILEEYLDNTDYLVPITTEDLCNYATGKTGERPEIVRPSVNTALRRLERIRPDLFRFQNGIYYRAKETVFGYAKLDPASVVRKKYIADNDEVIGYETGLSLLNKAGLTTQVPAYCFVATNRHKGRGLIEDAPLKTLLSRPITQVTQKNHLYLQTLELIITLIRNRESIQADDPRALVYEHIKRQGLDAERLAYYAGKCGGGKLADELVKIYYRGAHNEVA
jgi:predicted transcriptional regulator of viral defense system